jgi:hypothetical protein
MIVQIPNERQVDLELELCRCISDKFGKVKVVTARTHAASCSQNPPGTESLIPVGKHNSIHSGGGFE